MLTVIVPVLNEEEGIQAFYDELIKVLPSLSHAYEIVFIDDGSTDESLNILKSFTKKNKHVRVFSFKTNRGKADALALGFSVAKGDLLVTMDADLQDKPSELHKFLEKQKTGVDVVCGFRKERKDKSQMVVISKFFNYLIGVLFGLKLHDIDCGYKLLTRGAADSLHIYSGLYRFIPLLLYQQGYIVDEVVVEHDTRKFGHSKYGFSKVFKNIPDLFTIIFLLKFGKRPLHFFGFIGIFLIIIGVGMLSYLTFIHYAFGERVGTRPILFVGILFIISGLQSFFTGFLADLIINISHTTRTQSDYTHQFPLKYSSEKEGF
jgi:glycosyltransferase involved in cell wall biosynthesis